MADSFAAALRLAVQEAGAGLSRVDAALCFLTTEAAANDVGRSLVALVEELGTSAILALRANALCDGQRRVDVGIGVSLLLFAGVEASLRSFPELRDEEERVGRELGASFAGGSADGELAFLACDGLSFAVDPCLDAIGAALPALRTLGLSVSDPLLPNPGIWCAAEPVESGLGALLLRLPRTPRHRYAPSCYCGASVSQVTRSEANWIFEIDGLPALERFKQAAGGRLGEDLHRAQEVLMIAIRPEPSGVVAGNEGAVTPPLVLEVVGVDPRRGALVLSEPLQQGARIAFALRDGARAREALGAGLDALRSPVPGAVLYLGDGSRGEALFDLPELEPAYLGRAFPDIPIAGAFGATLLGPGKGGPRRVGHSALAMAFPAES